MLKGIPEIITPELLRVLAEMGHTDELTIGDGNFPGHTYGKRVIRMDGHGVPEILDAILKLFPLDTYVDHPCTLMGVVKGDPVETPIWDEYKKMTWPSTIRAVQSALKKWTSGNSISAFRKRAVWL